MTATVARIVTDTDDDDTRKSIKLVDVDVDTSEQHLGLVSSSANGSNATTKLPSLMSPVNQMFNGRSVFITGASGFIGRVLLEKLLRCYQGIQRVYILMRPKKNVPAKERLNRQLLKAPIFDKIRSMNNGQELLDKIVVVQGDIGEEMFGLSDSDVNMMLTDETLSIVFHSAATVKFDEPLQISIKFNLAATATVISLCKRMPNLISLCHVSTAYVNSNLKENQTIEEKLYPIRQTPAQMIKLAELVDEELMQQIKPILVGDRPNTYTYTKALGEHLIALEASQLPVAIVRPSIVVAAWQEPLPGWVDNLNGPTGLVLATGKGLLRSMYAKRDSRADMVPVDIVVNTMIAAGFYAAKTSGRLDKVVAAPQLATISAPPQAVAEDQKDIVANGAETGPGSGQQANGHRGANREDGGHDRADKPQPPHIFHCTSGDINPVTWGDMEDTLFPVLKRYPSGQVFRYPFGTFKSNKYHDMVTRMIVHYLPALIIDLICMILGKKRQLVSIYFKIHSAVSSLSHFSTTNYNFKSNNIKLLQAVLTDPEDKRQLYTDIGQLDWIKFWTIYVLGARRFVLKEDDSTLDEARQSLKRAWFLEIALRTLLIIVATACCLPPVMRAAGVLGTIRA